MNLFDLSLKLNGFPIEKASALLKQIQNKNEEEFNAYLESKKKEIVEFHLKHNPFYKKFGKNVDITEWNNIPVMTKRDLQ